MQETNHITSYNDTNIVEDPSNFAQLQQVKTKITDYCHCLPTSFHLEQGLQHSGKTYHWCPQNKLWSLHKPEDCLLQDEKASEKKKKKLTNKMKVWVYQVAMQVMPDEEEEHDDSYSDEESSAGETESS